MASPTRFVSDLSEDGPQFELRRDRGLLAVMALVPGALLALGLVGLAAHAPDTTVLALLASHFVAQFLVLLVYGAVLANDAGLDPLGRAMWGTLFLTSAPLALPLYFAFRIASPEGRERGVRVREIALASA